MPINFAITKLFLFSNNKICNVPFLLKSLNSIDNKVNKENKYIISFNGNT